MIFLKWPPGLTHTEPRKDDRMHDADWKCAGPPSTLDLDSGVSKTIMARKHWEALQHLNATSTMFVAYGATQYLPIIGQTRLRLGNQRGRRLDTTAYVTKDKDESLLGKEDAMALSILCRDLEGGPPLDHHHHSRTPSPPPHHQEAAIPVK